MKEIIQSSSASVRTTNDWIFLPTNVTQTAIAGYAMKYMEVIVEPDHSRHASDGIAITQLIQERERDPRKAAALERARKKLATKLTEFPELSLAALRLRKGLSQARLAEIMAVKQPYIARIERGEDDLHVSTIENMAKALDVSPSEVFSAIAATRAGREAEK